MTPQELELVQVQFNHKIFRGAINVAACGSFLLFGFYLVEVRKVPVKDYLFISNAPSVCPEEANIDAIGLVDIGDLTKLIDYLYISYDPPELCL